MGGPPQKHLFLLWDGVSHWSGPQPSGLHWLVREFRTLPVSAAHLDHNSGPPLMTAFYFSHGSGIERRPSCLPTELSCWPLSSFLAF